MQKSDHAAVSMLYRRYFQLLFSYAFRMSKEKERSKDCVHDLFVYLWENREGLPKVGNVRAYLLTAVRNRMYKLLKRDQKLMVEEEQQIVPLEIIFSIEQTMINQEEDEEKHWQIKTALKELTDRQKELIYLQFYEGLSIQEIQQRTSLQYQSVKNLTYRALTTLRKALKKK